MNVGVKISPEMPFFLLEIFFFLFGDPFSLLGGRETKWDLKRETQICEIQPKGLAFLLETPFISPKTHLGKIRFVVKEIYGHWREGLAGDSLGRDKTCRERFGSKRKYVEILLFLASLNIFTGVLCLLLKNYILTAS